MKGKRKLRERLMVLALTFTMTAGMMVEPVRIRAAQSGETVNVTAVNNAEAVPEDLEGGGGRPVEKYRVSVSEKNGVTEAYSGDVLTFVAAIEGTAPENPGITWSADNNAVVTPSGNGMESTVTVPEGLAAGTKITVTAVCGDVSGSASVTVKEKTYNVSGTITSGESVVPGAEVRLGNFEAQTTDDNGAYSVSNVPSGTYNLVVKRNGFEEYQDSVNVNSADTPEVNAALILAEGSTTIDNSNIVVGETMPAGYTCGLTESEIQSVEWQSADATIAEVKNGTVKGVRAGTTTITATVHSVYGDVPMTGIGVTVEECGTEITKITINKEGIFKKRLNIDVTVTALAGTSIPGGGEVEFKIKQLGVNDDAEEKIYTETLDNGTTRLQLQKKNFDFSGGYLITVTYKGNPGYYFASAEKTTNYNYAISGLEYEDERGKTIVSDEKNPLTLTYGDEKKIWISEENETVNELFSKDLANVNIVKQDTSEKKGYTEFLITAQKAGTCEEVFKRTAGEERIYPYLYIKVEPKELVIDEAKEKTYMTYSKIYDDNKKVFAKADTNDVIVLNRMKFKDGVKLGDTVNVDLDAVGKINGSLSDGFSGNVTPGTETEITFNQNQLSLKNNTDGNYVLANQEITVSANVIVNKRPVDIKVSDATRSFGHAYKNGIGNTADYVFTPADWLAVALGTGEGISGVIQKGYKDPSSERALIEQQEGGNVANPGKYPGVLSVDTENIEYNQEDHTGIKNKDNYEFRITAGDLTIVPEKISELTEYLNLQNTPDNPTMYFENENKLWVKADKGRLKLTANEKKLYDEVLLKKIGEQEISPAVSLTGKGYEFNRKDVVGSEEVALALQLKNKAGALSQEFDYRVSLDNTIPKVRISDAEGTNTSLGDFVKTISFGLFGKTKYKVNVQVTETETSGLKEWTYMVLPLKEDMVNDTDGVYDVDNPTEEEMSKSKLLQYMESLKDSGEYTWKPMETSADMTEIPIDRKDVGEDFVANNYVVLVKPYDNVKNSKIYTSLGIILDNNDPYVELDLDYEGGQVYRDVYNDDVKLHMSITDNHQPADKMVSGLKRVYYQVAIGEKNLDKAEHVPLYDAAEGKIYTLEELQNEIFQRNITIQKELNSNDIWVRVTAVDNSDNEFQAFKQLKIDITKPKVSVRYETKATEHYAPYYKENRTAIVTVEERNADINNVEELWFDLKREGEQKASKYTVSSLKNIEGITEESVTDFQEGQDASQYTEGRTIEIRICFSGDNKYNFDVHCKDKGDWENEQDNSAYFVIDKTAPKVNVTYYNADGTISVTENGVGRFYSDRQISVKVKIKEHNFALDDKEVPIDVKVTADKVGAEESIPDYAAENKNLKEWSQNGDIYINTYDFISDANYTHAIAYTDLAGNTASYGPGYFTVDKTNPTGKAEIKGFGFWESLLEKITFGLFSPSTVDVEATGSDYTSPIHQVQYTRVHDQMTRDELEAYNSWSSASEDRPGFAGFSVSPDEQFIVYIKVTDYAGNYEFFSSDGMIVDSTKPDPVVTITNLSPSQNGIFNEDVTLQIDVEDPTVGDTYSGLEKVWYIVSGAGNVNTSETIELLNNSKNRTQGNKTFRQVITVPASVYNSNDVKVQAFAQDFSGNQGESEITELKIDVTNPTISVSWDLNNPSNGRYYKDIRTATVTVTDRNFDEDNVRFNITNTDGTEANISGWSSSSNIGVSDHATSTCQVSFPADGDYTFTLGCTDLAGNSGEYGQTDEFTIDKTIPVITVSYDNNSARNGNYFKEARTAIIKVQEHNFNSADVRAAVTAALQGRGISAPSVSGFSDSGDVHTATVRYAAEGDYTFDVDYIDMAGNQAADYTSDSFTVDLTKPEVEIVDIKDKSANNDVVAPGVKVTDANYDAQNVTISVIGANNGKVDIGKAVRGIENGQSIKMNDFAREEKMDDLYKLTAKSVDRAGNETEKSVMFSVNRYGSVYILDDDTWADKGGWLDTKDYTYIRKEQDLGVVEYNVDTIESNKITVNRDGELETLKENQDYTVKNSGSNVQWKENHYVIDAENFAEEGNYNVLFNTRDRASNTMNNTSVKKNNKNLPIEFTVDKTAPTVVVSGVEDGGQYRSAEKNMIVDAKDNLALAKVIISVDGEKTVYNAEKLRKLNGMIETAVSSANSWQNIEITSEDAAGNQLGQTEENDKAQPVVMKILVTSNIVIQYYMNKPLFYGSIAVIVIMVGLIVLLVWRKKK